MINLNLMKKLKKSTWVTLALLIYVSVTAAYLLPRNTEVSDTEKYITLAISYVIVFILQPDTLYVKDFFLLYDNYCSLYDIFLFSSPIPSSCQGRKKRLQ